jgi:hypothetical protein
LERLSSAGWAVVERSPAYIHGPALQLDDFRLASIFGTKIVLLPPIGNNCPGVHPRILLGKEYLKELDPFFCCMKSSLRSIKYTVLFSKI